MVCLARTTRLASSRLTSRERAESCHWRDSPRRLGSSSRVPEPCTACQPPDLLRLDEEYPGAPDPLDPATAYGQAKRAAEFICSAASATGGPAAVIARCFAFVGPHLPLNTNYAIGNFIGDALAARPISVAGDGTPLRSYLYAADLTVWLWTLLLRGAAGRVYNVGSDEPISIRELAQRVADVVAPGLPVSVARDAPSDVPPPRYVPSIDRARQELGLAPLISLDAAIARTAAWHRGERSGREGPQ